MLACVQRFFAQYFSSYQERYAGARPIAESPREVAVQVIPASVVPYESAYLMQSMCFASDLVARHKFDGRCVSGLLVMRHLQAQPFRGVQID